MLIRMRTLGMLLAAMLGSLVSTQTAHAMRFVEFRIYLNGQFILITSTGDHGDKDQDAVWDYLKSRPLRVPDSADRSRDRQGRPQTAADPQTFVIKADAGNPLQATIKGKIKVFSPYSYTREASALRLVRKNETDDVWRIAPDEVDRLHHLGAKGSP